MESQLQNTGFRLICPPFTFSGGFEGMDSDTSIDSDIDLVARIVGTARIVACVTAEGHVKVL